MSEIILLSGVLSNEDVSEEFRQEFEPREFQTPRELWCRFVVYHVDSDDVRTYNIKGVQGDITAHEPAIEDRKRVDAIRIADLLVDNGIDVHDIKDIIWEASRQLANSEHTVDMELFRKADNAYHQLGGLE
jgi:hypothetical protein